MNHADNQGELHSGQGAQLPVQGPWGETTSSVFEETPSVFFEVCCGLCISVGFFVGDFIFKNAPQRRAEVLFSVPKCLKEQMHMIRSFVQTEL